MGKQTLRRKGAESTISQLYLLCYIVIPPKYFNNINPLIKHCDAYLFILLCIFKLCIFLPFRYMYIICRNKVIKAEEATISQLLKQRMPLVVSY